MSLRIPSTLALFCGVNVLSNEMYRFFMLSDFTDGKEIRGSIRKEEEDN
jgi:hypothetical protein